MKPKDNNCLIRRECQLKSEKDKRMMEETNKLANIERNKIKQSHSLFLHSTKIKHSILIVKDWTSGWGRRGMNYLPLLRTFIFFFFLFHLLVQFIFSFFIYLPFFVCLYSFLSEVSKPKRNSFNTKGGQRENGENKRKRNNERKKREQRIKL